MNFKGPQANFGEFFEIFETFCLLSSISIIFVINVVFLWLTLKTQQGASEARAQTFLKRTHKPLMRYTPAAM